MSPSSPSQPEELKDMEERLRFLLSKIDSELERFKSLKQEVEEKKKQLLGSLKDKGIEPIPIELSPSESMSLAEDVDEHIKELQQFKNSINMKLKNVLREEELIDSLKKEYGENVEVKRDAANAFKIIYKDPSTAKIHAQVRLSKKLISSMREDLEKMGSKKNNE